MSGVASDNGKCMMLHVQTAVKRHMFLSNPLKAGPYIVESVSRSIGGTKFT